MDTKLTLKLDAAVIDDAKAFAKQNKTSISRMVEVYLRAVTNNGHASMATGPLVQSLIGSAKLPADYDHRADMADHSEDKHR